LEGRKTRSLEGEKKGKGIDEIGLSNHSSWSVEKGEGRKKLKNRGRIYKVGVGTWEKGTVVLQERMDQEMLTRHIHKKHEVREVKKEEPPNRKIKPRNLKDKGKGEIRQPITRLLCFWRDKR